MPHSSQPPLSLILASPLGKLGIAFQQDALTRLELVDDSHDLVAPQNALAQQVAHELALYFTNPKHEFTFKYHLEGSSFQKATWQALQHIPCGNTLTYGQLAKQLNTSARAIGQGCRTNPLPILIPCHRIVAAHHAGGYAGARQGRLLDIKLWLLRHEGISLPSS